MIVPDLSHINTEEFSPEAKRFNINALRGFEGYIDAPRGSLEWKEYWDEQEAYCLYGYSVGGVRITGEHYFYLNFCQIHLKEEVKKENVSKSKRKVSKRTTFPAFWDSDYFYFHECEMARENGQHMIVVKPRRRGYSYKNAAKCAYNYTFVRKSTSLILSEQEKYTKETMGMAVDYLDFLLKHTDFGKQRQQTNRRYEEVMASFIEKTADGRELVQGFKSRIMGFTALNNPDVARGKDANVILFEEAGSFGNLLATYRVTRATVEEGLDVSGQIFVYGCVCAGTKVWTNEGKLINIEELHTSDGILGYDGKSIYRETIGGIKPPAQKHCYRIETTGGNYIECSEDHPLLWSNPKYKVDRGSKGLYKKVTFKEASKIQKGDQLMMIKEVPVFGNKFYPEARIIGLLIGDGNYTKGTTPQLSVSDDEIFKYVDQNQEVTVYKHYRIDSKIDYKTIGIRNFKTNMVKHSIYGQVKLEKTLPPNIHEWDEKSVCELLGGYYDADGNVYYNEKKKAIRIVLSSICQPLLEQVKYQLLKLGIRSSIVKEPRNKLAAKISAGQLDHIYRLYINTNEDVKIFKSKIKFLSKHKQEVLDKIEGLNSYGHYSPKKIEYELNLELKKGTFFVGQKDMQNMTFVTVTKVIDLGMQNVYNLHTTHTNTYLSNGFITKQTGGDFTGGQVDFEKMFYDPETYGFRAYENIYDDGKEGTLMGYFLPDYYSKGGFINGQGISETDSAKQFIEAKIENLKRTSKDPNEVDSQLAEFPTKPSEAFIKVGTNVFPKAELNQQINTINSSKSLQYIGVNSVLYINDKGKVVCEPSDDVKPIMNYPYKPDVDGEGCVIIYQPPYTVNGIAPNELYFIAVDPYAIDKGKDKKLTKRDSLGAAYVFKRVNNFSKPYDMIVAEYVARPQMQDDYNKNLFLLAEYYNAKIVFENDRDGDIIAFARINKLLHRLQEEVTVFDSNDSPRKKLGRSYGVSMSNIEVKKQAVGYLKDWLLTKREATEDGEHLYNLHKIFSVPLLSELIKFSYEGNYDRVSAMLVAMLYKKELMLKPEVTDKPYNPYQDQFFNNLDRMFGLNKNTF